MFVCFFKCSFLKRVCVVIFDLDKVSTSNFDKFQFQPMTLKIERAFEKTNKILSQKLAKMAKTGQNGPPPMKNFLHEEKIHFFVRLSHYILLKTSVWSLKSLLANFPMV